MELKKSPKLYQKDQSFESFFSSQSDHVVRLQIERALKIIKSALSHQMLDKEVEKIIELVLADLQNEEAKETLDFTITRFVAEEMSALRDDQIISFLYHRYRYDVFPKVKQLDSYPPYLQIEPTSICNYRCIFCYQTDNTFSQKNSGHMGTMSFELYKKIVDQIEKKIQFVSLASRGEPLICKDIIQMLEYSVGKFLNLKLNTNVSLMTEKHAHAVLSGGVNTIVFSADSAEEPLYSQLRVNGALDTVLRKIEMFQNIRVKHYSDSKLISRVSGVRVNDQQNLEPMQKMWGGLVDQVSFVKYNPWENVYKAQPNTINDPCSDLWRRVFVWYNGVVNPCDCDYKSTLALGNIQEKQITELWQSKEYQKLRSQHLSKKRALTEPCKRCWFI